MQKAKSLSFWLNLAFAGESSFEQGEGSRVENIELISEKSDGDSTLRVAPPYRRIREPLNNRSGGLKPMLSNAPRQEDGGISTCLLPSSPCFFVDFHSYRASAGYFTKTLGVRTSTNQNQSSPRTLCLLSHQGFVNKIVGKFVNHHLTEGY